MKDNDTVTDVLTTRPTCDICRSVPAAVDGKTEMGPWAYMCWGCFAAHGVGLGLGKGQKLEVDGETI